MPSLPPGLLLVLAGLLVPFLRGRLRQATMLAAPLLSLLGMIVLGQGDHLAWHALGHDLLLVRADALALAFGAVFHVAAFLGVLFILRQPGRMEPAAALLYAGSAIGAVFAGDLLTFFLWWEVVGVAPVFLILARGGREAARAGLRYLVWQILSGVLLLAGIAVRLEATGSLALETMALGDSGTWLIFLAFGIKCGWPLLHAWIPSTYPAATAGGPVFLSAFTTKLAVYALARCFPGAEPLVWIGAVMALFPVFYAILENDLRRVLCYSMINQVGYMVCAIGVGSDLAIAGATAHAVAHILYKSLLFMSLGAVMQRTGETEATALGGLHRAMPFTAVCCGVGAASISAVPFFSGFVTKSIILAAVAQGGYVVPWAMLLVAAAAVLPEAGFKIPYFAFFGPDRGLAPERAPGEMRLAMGLTAGLCVLIGVAPPLLYALLPHEVTYGPYTFDHIVTQLALLSWSALAVLLLFRARVYPRHRRERLLDVDWIWEGLLGGFLAFVRGPLARGLGWGSRLVNEGVPAGLAWFARNPAGAMRLAYDRLRLGFVGTFGTQEEMQEAFEAYEEDVARYATTRPDATWPIGRIVLYVALVLLIYLVIDLLREP